MLSLLISNMQAEVNAIESQIDDVMDTFDAAQSPQAFFDEHQDVLYPLMVKYHLSKKNLIELEQSCTDEFLSTLKRRTSLPNAQASKQGADV